MSVEILSNEAVEEALKNLAGWSYDQKNKAITKSFKFKDFKEAFAFMTRVALMAEQDDHHPEWFNVYNRIDVKMTTHDVNGVSEKDIRLATAMNSWC